MPQHYHRRLRGGVLGPPLRAYAYAAAARLVISTHNGMSARVSARQRPEAKEGFRRAAGAGSVRRAEDASPAGEPRGPSVLIKAVCIRRNDVAVLMRRHLRE